MKNIAETNLKISKLDIKVRDIMEEGDRVAIWAVLTGEDESKKKISRNDFSIFHVDNGKISSIWTIYSPWKKD